MVEITEYDEADMLEQTGESPDVDITEVYPRPDEDLVDFLYRYKNKGSQENQDTSQGVVAAARGGLTINYRREFKGFMWNNLTGTIPKEIGHITSLRLLLLNGNKLSGSLPDELGNLMNMNRLQLDENQLSGSVLESLANMINVRHLHMNNNSFAGQLPSKLSNLSNLMHLLLDNNNLSGYLPPEFSKLHSLEILQLDNNNFSGNGIPSTYENLPRLVKLSLRNCSLQGAIPDLNSIPSLKYLDLSWNQFTGSIPSNNLSTNMTTVDLSHNKLNGSIPRGGIYPYLQRLKRKTGIIAAIIIGAVAAVLAITAITMLLIFRRNSKYMHLISRKRTSSNVCIKIDGVKAFTLKELTHAANKFDISTKVGEGGYGNVYKGILSDETFVAVKRAGENSLQGQKEFLTEIELLSRLHHRNLVSLLGYCSEEGEQMLIYEFMPNGTLREWISGKKLSQIINHFVK
ncbi:hypothetical protein KIW84_021151 [Lathyrus oleraceus]|uniref:Protein kinase domain-containing protein n=1 Tax=Pisum sativum TaxID=3888 RepID=A0A9D5B888_PEA|nr:hypothetical protein KIW84_021151 [Pisum sativum]